MVIAEYVLMSSECESIHQNRFMRCWLIHGKPNSSYTKFKHTPLVENKQAREIIFVHLAKVVFLHHNNPEEYRQNLETLGYPGASKEIDQRPSDPNTRKGNFGEILASEYLQQYEGYTVPVYRLQYNSNPNSSMKGDDVLAFKFGESDDQVNEVLVVEAKVRKQFTSDTVREAYEQFGAGPRPRPKSLVFIANALRKEGKHDKANQVLIFLRRPSPHRLSHRYMIFLVTENKPKDPFRYIQEQESPIENLAACNLSITNLDDFVKAIFEYKVEI